MYKKVYFLALLASCCSALVFGQENTTKIDYTSERTAKDEEKYPEALLMYKVNNQVIFKHEGVKVWCDQAVFYEKDNFFRASGNVRIEQGDTITLTSQYAEYDGDTEFAFASNQVFLETDNTTLTTDSLFFDRQKQEAFYRSFGTVQDTSSTITSQIGRYYINEKKYSFQQDVVVTNEEYIINSDHIEYFPDSGQAFLYGPSTITSSEDQLYCERGFYDTQKNEGNFVKNSKVYYENRELRGDSIYFNRERGFASATNNIKVIDTLNESVVRGHYAEVFKEKDSVFITKRALVSKRQDNDSIHIHADTIMVTGEPEHRMYRAYYNAKILKEEMSGKANSIVMDEAKGLTKMLGKPVLFSDENQLTGDTIELYNHLHSNKLDSLSVFDNAFLVQKDSIEGYNQIKGKVMFGLFNDNNQLDEINFIKNTETIYYWRDDKTGDLIGINKAVASSIKATFEDNELNSIEYTKDPENITYRPIDFPQNARRLRGFIWRGDERIFHKSDLFKDDPPFSLPKIRGIPLPDDKSFFREGLPDEQPLLNPKSRLSPHQIKDSTDLESKKEKKEASDD